MKTVDVKLTDFDLIKLTGKKTDTDKKADTCDFIEVSLDNIPQGGFSPKDIRERNRIQIVLDKYREEQSKDSETKKGKPQLKFEDADYDALKIIINAARWGTRDKILQDFLDTFKTKE